MHVTHRKRFVSRDLVALAARRPQELAALSEAHYHCLLYTSDAADEL